MTAEASEKDESYSGFDYIKKCQELGQISGWEKYLVATGQVSKQKLYNVSEFTDEEIALAKKYMQEALLGFIELTIEEKIDQFFERLSKVSWASDDHLHLVFSLDTVGNDILVAIGAGRRNIKNQEGA